MERFIMPGDVGVKVKGSAAEVARLKTVHSVKSVGSVTRNDPMPEELLEILVDHLKRINNSGIEVEMIPVVTRKNGVRCVGFLVMNVEVVQGKLRRIVPLPEKE
jgi:hypothetical protein